MPFKLSVMIMTSWTLYKQDKATAHTARVLMNAI